MENGMKGIYETFLENPYATGILIFQQNKFRPLILGIKVT